MRYMMIVKHAENQGSVPRALMEAIGKLMEEDAKNGRTLIANGGLRPTAQGARVRISGGKLSMTDEYPPTA